jgi:hypothetical protein
MRGGNVNGEIVRAHRWVPSSRARIASIPVATVLVVATSILVASPNGAGASAYPLPGEAVFEFEADGVAASAGDVIEVGGETVATLTEDVSGFETVQVAVPAHLLRSGRIDVALVSGNTGTGQTERYDDFAVQNVRLMLADGSQVVDERYAPDRPYLVGDGFSIEEDPGDIASVIPTFGYLPSRTEDVLRREFRFVLPRIDRTHRDAPEVPEVAMEGAGFRIGVTDPNGDAVDVELMGADEAELVAAAAGQGFAKPHEENPGATPVPLPGADIAQVAELDGTELTTTTTQGFPTQEFTLRVDPAAAQGVPHLDVVWEGRTAEGTGATLYVFDRVRKVWAEVDSTPDASGGTVLSGAVDVASTMAEDGRVRLQVQEERFRKEDSDFSIAWLTDTQFYAENFPEVYDTMNEWIVDSAEAENIIYAIHTGDITQNYNQREWEWTRASASMEILEDGGVPYGIVTGNHDIGTSLEPGAQDHVYYDEYFPVSRFEGSEAEHYEYGGHFGDNNRNHYDLVSYEGLDFLFLYLDWAADTEEIAWANEVLQAHPDRHAILATHQYINPNGDYTNDGARFFEEIIVPNDNMFMVLCGHHIGAAYNVRRIPLPNGGERVVMEVLHDYQGGPDGGSGYLRLMRFDVDELQVDQQPYSPYTDDFDYGAEENGWGGDFVTIPEARDDYTLALDLAPIERELATDRIAVLVRTGEIIASSSDVGHGGTVVLPVPSTAPSGLVVRLTDPGGAVSESRPYLTR